MFVKSFIRFRIHSRFRTWMVESSFARWWPFPLQRPLHSFARIRVRCINAPLAAGILDARTSIISRSRVTDSFHFPFELLLVRGGRIFITLDANDASGTHHRVLPAWTRIIHTVHRLNDNSLSTLTCVDMSQYLSLSSPCGTAQSYFMHAQYDDYNYGMIHNQRMIFWKCDLFDQCSRYLTMNRELYIVDFARCAKCKRE